MSRRVRILAAALLALSLVVNVPTASAAVAVRDRDGGAGIRERIIQTIKKVLKPLTSIVNDDDEYKPLPPRP